MTAAVVQAQPERYGLDGHDLGMSWEALTDDRYVANLHMVKCTDCLLQVATPLGVSLVCTAQHAGGRRDWVSRSAALGLPRWRGAPLK